MGDLISRQDAIIAVRSHRIDINDPKKIVRKSYEDVIRELPSAEPEIIKCKDCKFYSPMNRETKTGICNLTMHQNFGDNWFCAGAERRTE